MKCALSVRLPLNRVTNEHSISGSSRPNFYPITFVLETLVSSSLSEWALKRSPPSIWLFMWVNELLLRRERVVLGNQVLSIRQPIFNLTCSGPVFPSLSPTQDSLKEIFVSRGKPTSGNVYRPETNRLLVRHGYYSCIANDWTKIPAIFRWLFGIFRSNAKCL